MTVFVKSVDSLRELPGKATNGGHVYVLLFGSGVVKVGLTTNPRSRIPSQERTARQFGVELIEVWVSDPIPGFVDAERCLIRFAWLVGQKRSGEHFVDISGDDVIMAARKIAGPGAIEFFSEYVKDRASALRFARKGWGTTSGYFWVSDAEVERHVRERAEARLKPAA